MSKEKKLTAVEWLENELIIVERNLINKTFLQLNKTMSGHKLKDIFEQAKELEKQQIIDAHYEDSIKPYSSSEQYYNETYKK